MKGISRAGVLLAVVVAMAGVSPACLAKNGSSSAVQNRMPPRGINQPPQPDRIRVGGGFHTGGYFYRTGGFRYPSPLQRSVFPNDACYGVYDARVRPGGVYALNMRLPRDARGAHVYLANRWPVRGNQDLRRLPFNQNGSPLQRGVYRWRFGIAPGGYGGIVYIVVVAPWLCGEVSPYYGIGLNPWQANGGAGAAAPVMQMQGPMRLDLRPSNMNGDGGAGGGRPQASMPLPGDMIVNPDFSRDLLDWQAISGGQPTANANFVRHTRQGIELQGMVGAKQVGIRQRVGKSVGKASSLILEAALMVTHQHGKSNPHQPSGLTIEICYGDANGYSHCGPDAFRRHFEPLPLGSDPVTGVERVPSGAWYRETFDLMTINPKPVRIDSITLIAPNNPEASAWVRNVHLLAKKG